MNLRLWGRVWRGITVSKTQRISKRGKGITVSVNLRRLFK